MAVINLTNETFDEAIAKGVTLVAFGAGWCAPCQMIADPLAELAEEFDGRAVIATVETDANPELAAKMKIRLLPTIISYKDGVQSEKAYGAESKERMAEMINALL